MLKQGDMLAILAHAEMAMGGLGGPAGRNLLDDPDGWNSLDVDYEPPRVERLWRPFQGDYRLYLHRIYPCEKALFHPHPWPSAVKIMTGSYEMGVGYREPNKLLVGEDDGSEPPPVATTIILTKGSTYEMINPHGWHWVRPLGGTSYSIMVTGRPWEPRHWVPRADHKLGPITNQAKADILALFRSLYGR